MSAFIQPDGSINPIFRSYLVENNCACSVRAPLFFSFLFFLFFPKKKKTSKKKTKIRGGGRGTQPPMAHAHRTQHVHR